MSLETSLSFVGRDQHGIGVAEHDLHDVIAHCPHILRCRFARRAVSSICSGKWGIDHVMFSSDAAVALVLVAGVRPSDPHPAIAPSAQSAETEPETRRSAPLPHVAGRGTLAIDL